MGDKLLPVTPISPLILSGKSPADFVAEGDEGLRGEEGVRVEVEPLLKTSLERWGWVLDITSVFREGNT